MDDAGLTAYRPTPFAPERRSPLSISWANQRLRCRVFPFPSVMRLWFLCCALLFAVSQGYDWISQQPWFGSPHFALHWVILGGLGLAIASNQRAVRSRMAPPQPRPSQPSPAQGNEIAPPAIAPMPPQNPAPLPASPLPAISTTSENPAHKLQNARSSSISFEIPKKQRSMPQKPSSL